MSEPGRWRGPPSGRRRVGRFLAGLAACITTAAFVPGAAPAQSATGGPGPHGFILEAGRFWQGLDDDLASTTQYQGDAALVGAGYRFRGARWRIGVSAARAGTRLTPRGSLRTGTHEDARWWTGDMWALRRVWRSGDGRAMAFAGPALALDLGMRRHFYRLDRSDTFDNAFLGLEATGQLEMAVGEQGRLSGRLGMPVLGLAVRTPYNTGLGGVGPDISVGAPPAFLLFRHHIEYRVTVSERLVVGLRHEGTVVRHDRPMAMTVAWHRLGLAIELPWGRP